MDMTGAYDHVIKDRLTHILREKGVPAGLTGWVHSFMSNRRATFMSDGQESELLNIAAGIPQGSPISPILFLFYNSELLDICNPRDIRVSSTMSISSRGERLPAETATILRGYHIYIYTKGA